MAASAAPGGGNGNGNGGTHATGESGGDDDLMASFAAFQDPRLSPSGAVTAGAYGAAWQHVQGMPVNPASYSEVTTQPLNSDPLHFRDRSASNSGGGAGFSAGRIAALAVDPTHSGVVYAGGADGGVFRSADDGATWTPIADHLPALSVGALAVAPDGALWLATGEATTAFDNFLGSGVYRLANPATSTFSSTDKVGGGELDNTSIHVLRFDTAAGYVFAASSHGVFRRAIAGPRDIGWQKVLAPCAGIGGSGVACGTTQYYADIANDVVVQPGTGGKRLLANVAWRSGAGYNGFYYSNDGGTTWAEANPLGAINPRDIGNATFAYSADGSRLYVVLESPILLNKATGAHAPATVLAGVFVSPNGDVNGPYNQIATSAQLAASGSAMALHTIGPGYQPGVQAWYDQSLIVDPADPMHVYMGLEELYESRDGGASWHTVGRYWNFGLACFSYTISANTCDGD
ncbi:MAG: WD40/YVTN/BNR-like repeat-containing protein, partial [Catenulispora sp.]